MPNLQLPDVTLAYEERGDGPETIVFAHGLLFDRRIFEHQMAALSDRYRVIAFDFRGHGESGRPREGYGMDDLAADTAALVERLGAAPCHYVGLSMGGFVGLRLASRRPELVRSLTLIDTSADPEPRANLPRYRLLNTVARLLGLRAVAAHVMPIVFGATTRERRPELVELWRRRIGELDRWSITRAVLGVIGRDGMTAELDRIRAPTLVIVGEEDTATVPEKAVRLRDGIAGAELVIVPRAGHMTSIEAPEAVTEALERFLGTLGGAPPEEAAAAGPGPRVR